MDYRIMMAILLGVMLSSLLFGAASAQYVDESHQTLWSPVFNPSGTTTLTDAGEVISVTQKVNWLNAVLNTMSWNYACLQSGVGEILRWGILMVISIIAALMIFEYIKGFIPFMGG